VRARLRRPGVQLALALLVPLGTSGAIALAAEPPPATHSCGWAFRLAGDQANVAYPDQAAQYWVARVTIPPGGYVEADGHYPHGRYISLITYTGASQAIDGLADINIRPDPGSINPFVAGANRNAPNRSYRVYVKSGPAPATGREPNTVYTDNGQSGTNSKSSQGGTALIYRVYEADRGLDLSGGVGLPTLKVVAPGGQATTLPDCMDTSAPDVGLTQALAASGFGALPDTVPTGLGGRNPPVWTKYTNAANGVSTGALNNETTGSAYPSAQQGTNQLPSGGFYENINNAYVFSFYSAAFGDVLLLRAKAPATPRTYDGEPVMQSGQLRYYSFCTNTAASNYLACRNDDAIPSDSQGYYSVAISTAANRPSNATDACGVAWLPAGPTPQSVLILRNMLPAANFAQAIQNAKQGTEEQTMGSYYPRGTYFHRVSDFEKLGCHPPTVPSEFQTGGGRVNSRGLPSTLNCRRRARWSFRLHAPRGERIVTATVYLSGKPIRRLHGHRLRRVTLSLPAGRTFTLRIVTRTNRGTQATSVRTYRRCVKTRPRTRVRRRHRHRS
jgi:hypothetical protein